ncbi:MAG: hypothetical protein OER21_05660 [Gemmatimonadota bacterium]|nr:hypothetical protein [Gemmatimonadota bacterium]
MTAAVEAAADRSDVRTILTGGAILGVLTAVGVTAFALLSRALAGAVEVIVQAGLIVLGGVVVSYLPASRIRPRSVDGIAWAAMIGLLGALGFTVLDTAILRPLQLYHWTWDAIGGGSGFWYIPVWWMGSAVLAWLGAWVVAMAARGGREAHPVAVGAQSAGVGVLLFAAAAGTRLLPFHATTAALAFAVGLGLHVLIAAVAYRK